ncbi:MAG: mannose-6-phosphate isomerase, class I [Candidatus Omnitrophota bacterium]
MEEILSRQPELDITKPLDVLAILKKAGLPLSTNKYRVQLKEGQASIPAHLMRGDYVYLFRGDYPGRNLLGICSWSYSTFKTNLDQALENALATGQKPTLVGAFTPANLLESEMGQHALLGQRAFIGASTDFDSAARHAGDEKMPGKVYVLKVYKDRVFRNYTYEQVTGKAEEEYLIPDYLLPGEILEVLEPNAFPKQNFTIEDYLARYVDKVPEGLSCNREEIAQILQSIPADKVLTAEEAGAFIIESLKHFNIDQEALSFLERFAGVISQYHHWTHYQPASAEGISNALRIERRVIQILIALEAYRLFLSDPTKKVIFIIHIPYERIVEATKIITDMERAEVLIVCSANDYASLGKEEREYLSSQAEVFDEWNTEKALGKVVVSGYEFKQKAGHWLELTGLITGHKEHYGDQVRIVEVIPDEEQLVRLEEVTTHPIAAQAVYEIAQEHPELAEGPRGATRLADILSEVAQYMIKSGKRTGPPPTREEIRAFHITTNKTWNDASRQEIVTILTTLGYDPMTINWVIRHIDLHESKATEPEAKEAQIEEFRKEVPDVTKLNSGSLLGAYNILAASRLEIELKEALAGKDYGNARKLAQLVFDAFVRAQKKNLLGTPLTIHELWQEYGNDMLALLARRTDRNEAITAAQRALANIGLSEGANDPVVNWLLAMMNNSIKISPDSTMTKSGEALTPDKEKELIKIIEEKLLTRFRDYQLVLYRDQYVEAVRNRLVKSSVNSALFDFFDEGRIFMMRIAPQELKQLFEEFGIWAFNYKGWIIIHPEAFNYSQRPDNRDLLMRIIAHEMGATFGLEHETNQELEKIILGHAADIQMINRNIEQVLMEKRKGESVDMAAVNETAEKDIKARPIEQLNVLIATPGHIYKALSRAGITTIGKLTELTREELLVITRIGVKSADAIEKALAVLGLDLKDSEKASTRPRHGYPDDTENLTPEEIQALAQLDFAKGTLVLDTKLGIIGVNALDKIGESKRAGNLLCQLLVTQPAQGPPQRVRVMKQEVLDDNQHLKDIFTRNFGIIYIDQNKQLWILLAPDIAQKDHYEFLPTIVHESVEAYWILEGDSPALAHTKAKEAEARLATSLYSLLVQLEQKEFASAKAQAQGLLAHKGAYHGPEGILKTKILTGGLSGQTQIDQNASLVLGQGQLPLMPAESIYLVAAGYEDFAQSLKALAKAIPLVKQVIASVDDKKRNSLLELLEAISLKLDKIPGCEGIFISIDMAADNLQAKNGEYYLGQDAHSRFGKQSHDGLIEYKLLIEYYQTIATEVSRVIEITHPFEQYDTQAWRSSNTPALAEISLIADQRFINFPEYVLADSKIVDVLSNLSQKGNLGFFGRSFLDDPQTGVEERVQRVSLKTMIKFAELLTAGAAGAAQYPEGSWRHSLTYTPKHTLMGTSGFRGDVLQMKDAEPYAVGLGFIADLMITGQYASEGIEEFIRQFTLRPGLTEEEARKEAKGYKEQYVEFLKQLLEAKSVKLVAGQKLILCGDYRPSSDAFAAAVLCAANDVGLEVIHLGKVTTPTMAYYCQKFQCPGIMITGSHTEGKYNGLKLYDKDGEVLNEAEPKDNNLADCDRITASVECVREYLYRQAAKDSHFDADGYFKPGQRPDLKELQLYQREANSAYAQRLVKVTPVKPYAGYCMLYWRHSTVARDVHTQILEELGMKMIGIGERLDAFIALDTENMTQDHLKYLREEVEKFRKEHEVAVLPNGQVKVKLEDGNEYIFLGLTSSDGDGDRSVIVDEKGKFWRGDVTGAIVAETLGAQVFVQSLTGNQDVRDYLSSRGIRCIDCSVGSPYHVFVIRRLLARDPALRIYGQEVNGGGFLGPNFVMPYGGTEKIEPLITRCAILPTLIVMMRVIHDQVPVSALFEGKLDHYADNAGLIHELPGAPNISPERTGLRLLERYRPNQNEKIKFVEFNEERKEILVTRIGQENSTAYSYQSELGQIMLSLRKDMQRFFSPARGFNRITRMGYGDRPKAGIVMWDTSKDRFHVRPSGNAPETRIYVYSPNGQKRADEIVAMATRPGGILREIERSIWKPEEAWNYIYQAKTASQKKFSIESLHAGEKIEDGFIKKELELLEKELSSEKGHIGTIQGKDIIWAKKGEKSLLQSALTDTYESINRLGLSRHFGEPWEKEALAALEKIGPIKIYISAHCPWTSARVVEKDKAGNIISLKIILSEGFYAYVKAVYDNKKKVAEILAGKNFNNLKANERGILQQFIKDSATLLLSDRFKHEFFHIDVGAINQESLQTIEQAKRDLEFHWITFINEVSCFGKYVTDKYARVGEKTVIVPILKQEKSGLGGNVFWYCLDKIMRVRKDEIKEALQVTPDSFISGRYFKSLNATAHKIKTAEQGILLTLGNSQANLEKARRARHPNDKNAVKKILERVEYLQKTLNSDPQFQALKEESKRLEEELQKLTNDEDKEKKLEITAKIEAIASEIKIRCSDINTQIKNLLKTVADIHEHWLSMGSDEVTQLDKVRLISKRNELIIELVTQPLLDVTERDYPLSESTAINAMAATPMANPELQAIGEGGNGLLKRFSKEKDVQMESEIGQFKKEVIRNALELENGDAAKVRQIIAAQLENIIFWIKQGVQGAEKIELTTDEAEMLKHPDVNKYPLGSFLKSSTLPVAVTAKEFTPGFFWRGYEAAEKLGKENIRKEFIYDQQKFDAQIEKVVMYIMDHGFIEVPAVLKEMTGNAEGQISTLHETSFIHNLLPGSLQATSTGIGHAQKTSLDIKYVSEGTGIQFNLLLNAKGEVTEIIAQYLTPGTWTLALPGYVDAVINLGGLRFNDFSYNLPEEKAIAFVSEQYRAEVDFSRKPAATSPYLPVVMNGKPYLVQMQKDAPHITWASAPDAAIFGKKSLLELYPVLNKKEIGRIINTDNLLISMHKIAKPALPVISLEQMAAIQSYRKNPTPLAIHCKAMTSDEGYNWGDKKYIPALLRIDNSKNKPYAELWIGAHPKAPAKARVCDVELNLNDLISGAVTEILGKEAAAQFKNELPYLLKVLAAARPLSIQAHPNKEQARAGWLREKGKGPDYSDDNHKPEIICALTEFWALNGFRPVPEIIKQFEKLDIPVMRAILDKFKADKDLKAFYSAIMKMPQEEIDAAVKVMSSRAISRRDSNDKEFRNSEEDWVLRCAVACIKAINEEIAAGKVKAEDRNIKIRQSFRGIPSIYLLNLICLKPGEAMYLPAGELHAYLNGVGMELMASSDNVLRGGMTHKHMDIDELLSVLTFNDGRPIILTPQKKSAAEGIYKTTAQEFELSVIEVNAKQPFTSDAVHSADALIVLEGIIEVVDSRNNSLRLGKGQTFLLPAVSGSYIIKVITESAKLYKASVPKDNNSGLRQANNKGVDLAVAGGNTSAAAPINKVSSRDLKGPSAPETDPILKELIRQGKVAEIVYDQGNLSAYKVKFVEGYMPGKSEYKGEEIPVDNILVKWQQQSFLKWLTQNKVRGSPVKFRVILNSLFINYQQDISHSNIAHAGFSDQAIYIGELFLKYLFTSGNEKLREKVIDEDELRHLKNQAFRHNPDHSLLKEVDLATNVPEKLIDILNSNGDINFWDSQIARAAQGDLNQEQVKIFLERGENEPKIVNLQLPQVLFSERNRPIAVKYIGATIYNEAVTDGANAIIIFMENKEREKVLAGAIKEEIRSKYPRMSVYGNFGKEIEVSDSSNFNFYIQKDLNPALSFSPEYFKDKTYMGIDIGGWNIKLVVMHGFEVIYKFSTEVIKNKGGASLKRQILSYIKDAQEKLATKIDSLAITFPSPVRKDKDGSFEIIRMTNFERYWQRARGGNTNFDDDYRELNSITVDIQKKFGISNIEILNDADAFGFGEILNRIEKGVTPQHMGTKIVLPIGTGPGYAKIKNGEIENIPNQGGHMAIDLSDKASRDPGCELKGCYGGYVTASAIGERAKTVGLDMTGRNGVRPIIIDGVLKLLMDMADWIAVESIKLHKITGADEVILAGGVSQGETGKELARYTNEAIKTKYPEYEGKVQVVLSGCDINYGGAIGAAKYALITRATRLQKTKWHMEHNLPATNIGKNNLSAFLDNIFASTENPCLIISKELYNFITQKDYGWLNYFNNRVLFQDDYNEVATLQEEVQKRGFSVVMVIGAGTLTDWAKYTAKKLGIRSVIIPSALSANGMFTEKAIFYSGSGNERKRISFTSGTPEEVIIDTQFLADMLGFVSANGIDGYRANRAGVGDIISIYPALLDWELAEKDGKETIDRSIFDRAQNILRMTVDSAEYINDNSDIGMIILSEAMVEASLLNMRYGTSRPKDGSEHLLGDEIDARAEKAKAMPRLHGEVVAITSLVMAYLYASEYKPESFLRVESMIKSFGLPSLPGQIGATKEIIIEALQNVRTRPDKYTFFDKYGTKIVQNKAELIYETLFGTKRSKIDEFTLQTSYYVNNSVKAIFGHIRDEVIPYLDAAKTKELVDLLLETKNRGGRVIINAAGRIGEVAVFFQQKLRALGFCVDDFKEITPEFLVGENDLVLTFSGSGSTSSVIYNLKNVDTLHREGKLTRRIFSVTANPAAEIWKTGLPYHTVLEIKGRTKDSAFSGEHRTESAEYLPLSSTFEYSVMLYLEGITETLIRDVEHLKEDEILKIVKGVIENTPANIKEELREKLMENEVLTGKFIDLLLSALEKEPSGKVQKDHKGNIINKRRIYLFGLGQNNYVIRLFARRMQNIGFEVYVPGPRDIVSRPHQGDIAVFVSNSGVRPQIWTKTEIAEKWQCPIVLITAAAHSPFTGLDDIVIPISKKATTSHTADIMKNDRNSQLEREIKRNFEAAAMFYLEGISVAVMKKLGITENSLQHVPKEWELKGPAAPSSDLIIANLIKEGKIAEIYLEDGRLKIKKIRYIDGYVPGLTYPGLYTDEIIDIKEFLSDEEQAALTEWISSHHVRGQPVKFRIVLGQAALKWSEDINHSNVAHAGSRDNAIYIGELLFKYILSPENKNLRTEILDKDEYRHLTDPLFEHSNEAQEYLNRLRDVSEAIAVIQKEVAKCTPYRSLKLPASFLKKTVFSLLQSIRFGGQNTIFLSRLTAWLKEKRTRGFGWKSEKSSVPSLQTESSQSSKKSQTVSTPKTQKRHKRIFIIVSILVLAAAAPPLIGYFILGIADKGILFMSSFSGFSIVNAILGLINKFGPPPSGASASTGWTVFIYSEKKALSSGVRILIDSILAGYTLMTGMTFPAVLFIIALIIELCGLSKYVRNGFKMAKVSIRRAAVTEADVIAHQPLYTISLEGRHYSANTVTCGWAFLRDELQPASGGLIFIDKTKPHNAKIAAEPEKWARSLAKHTDRTNALWPTYTRGGVTIIISDGKRAKQDILEEWATLLAQRGLLGWVYSAICGLGTTKEDMVAIRNAAFKAGLKKYLHDNPFLSAGKRAEMKEIIAEKQWHKLDRELLWKLKLVLPAATFDPSLPGKGLAAALERIWRKSYQRPIIIAVDGKGVTACSIITALISQLPLRDKFIRLFAEEETLSGFPSVSNAQGLAKERILSQKADILILADWQREVTSVQEVQADIVIEVRSGILTLSQIRQLHREGKMYISALWVNGPALVEGREQRLHYLIPELNQHINDMPLHIQSDVEDLADAVIFEELDRPGRPWEVGTYLAKEIRRREKLLWRDLPGMKGRGADFTRSLQRAERNGWGRTTYAEDLIKISQVAEEARKQTLYNKFSLPRIRTDLHSKDNEERSLAAFHACRLAQELSPDEFDGVWEEITRVLLKGLSSEVDREFLGGKYAHALGALYPALPAYLQKEAVNRLLDTFSAENDKVVLWAYWAISVNNIDLSLLIKEADEKIERLEAGNSEEKQWGELFHKTRGDLYRQITQIYGFQGDKYSALYYLNLAKNDYDKAMLEMGLFAPGIQLIISNLYKRLKDYHSALPEYLKLANPTALFCLKLAHPEAKIPEEDSTFQVKLA